MDQDDPIARMNDLIAGERKTIEEQRHSNALLSKGDALARRRELEALAHLEQSTVLDPMKMFDELVADAKSVKGLSVTTTHRPGTQGQTTTLTGNVVTRTNTKAPVSVSVQTELLSDRVARAMQDEVAAEISESAAREPVASEEARLRAAREEFQLWNQPALEVMPEKLREFLTLEAVRMLTSSAFSGLERLWVYPNTIPNADTRPFGLTPKMLGYTAFLSGNASIVELLAMLNLRVSAKVLVAIREPVRDFPERIRALSRSRVSLRDQTNLNESRQAIALVNESLARVPNAMLLDSDHLPRTPMQVHHLSRATTRASRSSFSDTSAEEHYLLIDVVDTKFISKIAENYQPGVKWTQTKVSQLFSRGAAPIFMTNSEYYEIANQICEELGAEPLQRTIDQDCKVFPYKTGYIVRNHVYQWSDTESHYYPISIDVDHAYVVGVRASNSTALMVGRNDTQTIEAARNSLASLPFVETLTADVQVEWKRAAAPSMVFINNIRDITHSLPKPFFPLPGDKDDLSVKISAYIREYVIENYQVDSYKCVDVAAMGLDPNYVAISEAILYGENVAVPYGNVHHSRAALARIEEILASKSFTNQAKLKRITELLTRNIEGKPQAAYNPLLLT